MGYGKRGLLARKLLTYKVIYNFLEERLSIKPNHE